MVIIVQNDKIHHQEMKKLRIPLTFCPNLLQEINFEVYFITTPTPMSLLGTMFIIFSYC